MLKKLNLLLLLMIVTACSSTNNARKNAVKEAIRKETPKIRQCYNDEVKKRPGLEGQIVATFIVDNSTKAKNCKTATEMSDPALEKCVCDAILAAEYPAAAEGSYMDITYPFVFTDSNKDIPEEYRKLKD